MIAAEGRNNIIFEDHSNNSCLYFFFIFLDFGCCLLHVSSKDLCMPHSVVCLIVPSCFDDHSLIWYDRFNASL